MSGSAFSFSLEAEPSEPSLEKIVQEHGALIAPDLPEETFPDRRHIVFSIVGLFALSIPWIVTASSGAPSQSLAVTYHVISILLGLGACYLLRDLAFRGLASVRMLRVDAATVTALGVVALFFAALGDLFFSQGKGLWASSESFAFVTLFTLFFVRVAENIKARLFADAELPFVKDSEIVTVLEGSLSLKERVVSASELHVGDVIRLSSGEKVVTDAVILEGTLEVFESRLSGRASFAIKAKGENLFAGSQIISGKADCKVSSLPKESFITTFQPKVITGLHAVSAFGQGQKRLEERVSIVILFVATVSAVFWFGSGKGIPFSLSVLGGTLSTALLLTNLSWAALFYRNLLIAAFNKGVVIESFPEVIKSLAQITDFSMEYAAISSYGVRSVKRFDIIDERIDKNGLMSVIGSVLGRSQSHFHRIIASHARDNSESFVVHDVDKLSFQRDESGAYDGVIATIQGASVVMGTEEFLLSQGVQILPSEALADEEEGAVFLISMNGEILARCVLGAPFEDEGRELVRDLSRLKIRTTLMGAEQSSEVQKTGEQIGLSITDTFTNMSANSRVEKLRAMSPVALLCDTKTPQELLVAATVTFSNFDELLWNANGAGVVLVERTVQPISWLIEASRRLFSTVRFNIISIFSITAFLIVTQATGFIDPSFCAAIGGLSGLYLFFRTVG